MSETRASPYLGLSPYEERDAAFFFGRAHDTQLLVANLFASPLTLLYGPSGVGKTSLLQAGLVHDLRSRADVVPIVVRGWHAMTTTRLVRAVGAAGGSVDGSGTFSQALARTADSEQRRVMVILDQFEQYFVHRPSSDVDDALVQAIARPHALVSFVLSLREDAVARLDRFEGRIPQLFENYLRVEHLTRAGAEKAIVGPLREYRSRFGGEIEADPDLVNAVLDDLESEESRATSLGRGVVGGPGRIQTPYLQIVMARLWEVTRRNNTTTIERSAFEELGRSREIFFAHFDEVLAALPDNEQDILVRVFQYLVTPTGWKIALPSVDLASYANVDAGELEPILAGLASDDSRILRTVQLPNRDDVAYEIFHDVLAEAILEWRSLREQRQLQARYAVEYGATFSELVRAHWLWQAAIHQGSAAAEAEARHRSLLAGFQQAQGEIIEAFWAEKTMTAAALTMRKAQVRWVRRPTLRLHRESEWATRSNPKAADLLHRSDMLAIRAGAMLDGTREMIALTWTLSIQSHVLAAIDRGGDAVDLSDPVADAEAEFAQAEEYVRRAAVVTARRLHFVGAAIGFAAIFLLVSAATTIARAIGVDHTALDDAGVAAVAGAFGAVISVLEQTVRKTSPIDYEVGRPALRRLGAMRPFIGAILGVAVYFALAAFSSVVDSRYTLATLAFLAGFAERFARMTLVPVEQLAKPESAIVADDQAPDDSP